MSQSWTIGSGLDCDLVVELPGVSGRHCRLTRDDRGYLLEDLGSTNGTIVRDVRIVGPVRVAPGDSIRLGRSAPMPWPLEGPASIRPLRLGRDADNDIVIDAPMVSGRHALVGWDKATGRGWIEDQGSANGTAIGAPGRASGRLWFSASDVVFLGTRAFPGAWLMDRLGVRTKTRRLAREWPIAALLGQSAVVALAIVAAGAVGGPGARAATIASLLGVAAIWFGVSAILLDGFADPDRNAGDPLRSDRASTLRRLPSVAISCIAQCVFGWLVVASIAGLKAPAGSAIGLLILAATAGMALGGLIIAARPRLVVTIATAAVAIAAIGLLGGTIAPSRTVAAVMPSRWAFEGLLLLEPGASASVDRYFPAESARSGLTACGLALGLMAAGLAGAAAFIAWGPGVASGPGSASRPRTPSPASGVR